MLNKFEGKETKWEGLWYNPEWHSYSSAVINLSALKEFKGQVRLVVRKNRFYNKGENNRPNYIFSIKDSQLSEFKDIEVKEAEENRKPYYDEREDAYYTEDGERLFTKSEVIKVMDGANYDGLRGYDDILVSDYIPFLNGWY